MGYATALRRRWRILLPSPFSVGRHTIYSRDRGPLQSYVGWPSQLDWELRPEKGRHARLDETPCSVHQVIGGERARSKGLFDVSAGLVPDLLSGTARHCC